MKLEWLGHACFAAESGGYRIIMDPFKDVQGFADVSTEGHEVLCSHGHYDHAYRDGVHLLPAETSPFTVTVVDTFHDPEHGALRGTNRIHILSAEGMTAVHLGDLGHNLSEEQLSAVKGCDVLLIPVGGTYTIDSKQAKALADRIAPRILIPMHFRRGTQGFDVLEHLDDFLSLCPAEMIREYEDSTIEVTADTPAQIAVLHVDK